MGYERLSLPGHCTAEVDRWPSKARTSTDEVDVQYVAFLGEQGDLAVVPAHGHIVVALLNNEPICIRLMTFAC